MHLGDGITRVKAGERLKNTDNNVFAQQETTDEDTPAHPRHLAPSKYWITVDLGNLEEQVVEEWEVYHYSAREETVLVFLEGEALPTRELLSVVNTAHAVLVLRGTKDYFYLNADFVLPADGERALMEWGVGRPMFADSLLAVGGTLLVAFAERIWAPAVVGTLLVAATGYRVQDALTKVWRGRSDDWTKDENMYKLVPSGILGAERVVQGVLVTLADLLDDRRLLMAALTLASVQVVVLEYLGQACLTWGFARYNRVLCEQLMAVPGLSMMIACFLPLSQLFGPVFFSVCVSMVLISCACPEPASDRGISRIIMSPLFFVGGIILAVAGVWEPVVGWDNGVWETVVETDDGDLKISQSIWQ